MQRPPARAFEQAKPAARHAGLHRTRMRARPGPGVERRAEARARPVDHLHRAALGRGIGQRAGERAQRLGVDAGEGRDLDREPDRARVDIELAALVEGAPGQQLAERRAGLGRRPGLEPGRALEQVEQAARDSGHGSLQAAGAITARTHDPSR